MIINSRNQYHPDVHSSPGETLLETIEALNISPAELSQRMGESLETIQSIISGQGRITLKIASQLEQVLGVPASFWNNYEQHYRSAASKTPLKSESQI